MRLVRHILTTAFALASLAGEAAHVECTVVVRSEPQSILIKPSNTPYEVTKIDFDNGFRFAAQVLQDPYKFKAYTYFDSKDRYVLIHLNTESLDGKSCGNRFSQNTVYSPRLENELSYQCQLKCESP